MQPQTVQFLMDLNRRFYKQFGVEFAQTRQRIQNGVRRVLESIPDTGRWLDLGCGSGSLAVEWLKHNRQSAYLGVDFSETLLNAARQGIQSLPDNEHVTFKQANLGQPGWNDGISGPFEGILSFAVFHHLPSHMLRTEVLHEVHRLLSSEGRFIHSEWQFQNSPKLMARQLPWSTVGLAENDLEPGDTLLDWRFALPGQPEQRGLRYVHLFNREELQSIAQETGFQIIDEFESDGQGDRLGLYQVWQKA